MSTLRSTKTLLILALLALVATPALADFRTERDFELSAGGRLVLDSDVGSVVVAGSRDNGVHLLITAERDDIEEYIDFDFEADAGTVRITAKKIRRLTSWCMARYTPRRRAPGTTYTLWTHQKRALRQSLHSAVTSSAPQPRPSCSATR